MGAIQLVNAQTLQAVVWHPMVSHPALKLVETKWESASITFT
jgi:hypothetical protein